jgi:hypothetical protein
VTRRALSASIALAALVAACRPSTTAERPAIDPAMVKVMTVLATGRSPAPAEVARLVGELEKGSLTVAGYIERLITSDEFASAIAPLVILRALLSQDPFAAPARYVLKQTAGPDPIYYLYEPCSAAESERVHPWWNLDGEVRICRDSHRPAQWTAERPKGEAEMTCLSQLAPFQVDGGARCGCGPALLRCFESAAHQHTFRASLRDELRRSVEHAVARDLPAERIFTSNETFRDRNAEFVRVSQILELRREAHPEQAVRALARWPAEGTWAPREDLAPGQNAGILTAPHLVFFLPDRRQRMVAMYDVLWCIDADSVGATPEGLLSITGADLQIKNDGWRELAARPLCTNCHARLDYGLQFFHGYPNAGLQSFFVPALQHSGRGPLYARDIGDPRGEADLNPRGFAEMAVAQPEFRRCMARDVAEYVLGNRVTAEQIERVESVARPQHTSLRALMRAALAELARGWSAQPRLAASPAEARPPRASIQVTAELRRHLDDRCLACHDGDPSRPDLSGAELPRRSVVAALEEVASGRMPQGSSLAPAERAALLEAFIAAVWSGPDADAARTYFVDRMRALPAYRPEVILDLVHASAGRRGPAGWRMMENVARPNLMAVTPGMSAIAGLAAIEACREAHQARAERDRCIDEALRLDNLTSRPR